MEKKDYLYLALIVLFGFLLRFWIYGVDVLNLALGTLSIASMFFVGLEFEGIKKGKNAALICALITSVAPFLINVKASALVFFITSIVLYFALAILNYKAKKGAVDYTNWIFFLISSGVLIYFSHWSAVFILCTLCSIYLYKSKSASRYVAILPLIAPVVFYALTKMNYLHYQLNPINLERILFTFTDFFSYHTINNTFSLPSLDGLIHNRVTLGIGFFAFVILPLLIALCSIIKDYLKPKNSHFFLLVVMVSTFFATLIASLLNWISPFTISFVEIYPILILLMAAGFFTMKSKPIKTVLITLFVVLNLFYLIMSNFFPHVVFL